MKAMYFFSLLLLVAGCHCSNSSNNQVKITAEMKDQLRYLKEVEWPKSFREQDTVLLDRILAEEFQSINAKGNVSDKLEDLEWIKEHKTNYDSFRFEINRFNVFENGTAIISGTGFIMQDTSITEYKSSNVFILRKGEWKAIASHVSGVRKN